VSQFTARILPGTGFEINVDPDNCGDAPANMSSVQLRLRNPTTTRMTAAGMNAVIARINTYYSAAKLTAIQRAKGTTPVIQLSERGAHLDMLMADVASWVTNLTSDLAGTTNLTSSDTP
jgi:hypothetical protein